MPQSKRSLAALLLALLGSGLVAAILLTRHNKVADQVEGVVLDSAGQPVAEVRVFNRGDAAELIETHTDSDGRFCLRGFGPGPVYVFAQKDGYRFTGLRTECGASDARLTLLRRDESPPVWTPALAPMPLQEQQKLAHRLLEKLWAEDPRSKKYYSVIEAMSRIDPELATCWSAESNPGYAAISRAAMVEKVADADLDEAITLMEQSAPDLLVRLGRRYATSDRSRAMRCTEELIVRARALDQPWRAGYLAQAGALAMRLGKKDAGQTLLDEAAGMTTKLRAEYLNDRARGTVAAAMAETDFPRAQALLDGISSENGRDRFRGNVAVAGCLTHLDQALAIVGKMEKFADSTRLCIAYRLALMRPDEAIRVAKMAGIGAHGYLRDGRQFQSTVLGWVAEAIARRDCALAYSVIDRAFDVLLAAKEAESSSDAYGGCSAAAGFLAIQARQIGYQDMQSILYRVLGCRPTKKQATASDLMEMESTMAAFLALVDPQTAVEVLESAEQHGVRVHHLARIKAWLVAGAVRGESTFNEAIAAIKGKPDTDNEFYGLVEAVNVLAVPLSQKAQYIAPYMPYRRPDEE